MRNLGKQVNLIIDSGPTFPSPDNGELFIIDDPTNTIQDGLYWYSGKNAKWFLLAEIDGLDDVIESKVNTKIDNDIAPTVASLVNAQVPSAVTANINATLPAAVATEVSSKVTEEMDNRLSDAVTADVDSKLASVVPTVVASSLPAAITQELTTNPPKLKAEINGSDVEFTKLSPSSIVKLKDKGSGNVEIEYSQPTIELSMANPVDINSSSEIKVPFNVIEETDSDVFDFTLGTTATRVLKDGQYQIDYILNTMFDEKGRPRGSSKNSNVKVYVKVNNSTVKRKSVAYTSVLYGEAENATCKGGMTLNLSANDVIELCSKRSGNKAVTRLIEEETSLTIKLMRDM